jgi:hypothetical protein
MSRSVPASILTALGQSAIEPFYAVELDLDSGPLRLWTGYGDRTLDGNTYTGGGDLMGIEGLEEVADLSAKMVTLTLSGMPASIVSTALQEPYQRRRVRILFSVESIPGIATVSSSDFVEVFSGSLNEMTIDDGPESGTISVTVDSRLVELEGASNYRYTSESHKSRHATDTFFDFVADIQDKGVRFQPK